MNSATELKSKNKGLYQDGKKGNISKIRNKYILKEIFSNLKRIKLLDIIKYNKALQNKLNFSFNDYKEFRNIYSEIEIELIPIKNKIGNFINIINESEKDYFQIYFNDSPKKIRKHRIKRGEHVNKIKIIIDYKVKSFSYLFKECKCLESINFKKFYRNNITDMSFLFYFCEHLKEIKFNNFNTDNVNDMSSMFHNCESLKELDLSNFRTDNVTNMEFMFSGCLSLKKLNISNFNTFKVTNMAFMFNCCKSLKELNVSNFNTENVSRMGLMFTKCRAIKELNLCNFNTDKVDYMDSMFERCSSLKKLNICNFNFNKLGFCKDMFFGCVSLKEINLPKNNGDRRIIVYNSKGRIKVFFINKNLNH